MLATISAVELARAQAGAGQAVGAGGGRQAGSHHLYPAQPLGLTPKLQLIILCLSVIDEFRAISTNMEVLSNWAQTYFTE